MSWDRLIAIHDYYDQPRSGVAFMDECLVAFKCLWDEADDDYSKEYGVLPIDTDLLPLIEEAKSIFLRWKMQFQAGKTSLDTHPALPPDRNRHDQLWSILDTKLHFDEDTCERLQPTFKREEHAHFNGPTLPENWRVNWK